MPKAETPLSRAFLCKAQSGKPACAWEDGAPRYRVIMALNFDLKQMPGKTPGTRRKSRFDLGLQIYATPTSFST
jgi:hypothetical protein